MIQKTLLSLSFFTRLPVGKKDFGNLTLTKSVIAFPVAGAVVGALSGCIYLSMQGLGLPNHIAAWLALLFQFMITGGLHENGLADTADALASEENKEHKLKIMQDSNIGSYGVLALIGVISLKASIISEFTYSLHSLLIFIAAGACSRAFLVVFMRSIAHANPDSLATRAGKPSANDTIFTMLLGGIIFLIAGDNFAILTAIFTLMIIYVAIRETSLKNFGGITGDVLGAAQQISEAALLLILLFFSR